MKKVSVNIALFLFSFVAFSQKEVNGYKEKPNIFDNFYFNGNIGIDFSNNGFIISGLPQVGYKLTDRFSIGVGVNFQYLQISNISVFNYGGNAFSRYLIINGIFAQAEYERLNFQYLQKNGTENRKNYDSFLVGGGYAQPLGTRSSANITILYNLLYNPNEYPQPYNSPFVIRGGISLGFLAF